MEIDFDDFISNGGSDGCSGGLSKAWKIVYGKYPPFQSCCQIHDYNYFLGGNGADRFAADLDLFHCIYNQGYCNLAHIIFWAVRLCGEFDFVWKWKKYEYTLDK